MKLTAIKSLVAAALCAVGLSSFAAEPEAVQLWEGGPYFATCNIGATKPENYGILTNFNDAAQAVTDALGNGWRLPTKAEFEALLANCGKGTWTEQNGAKGRLFTGTGDYSSNSIFLPAAGYDDGAGRKWAGYQGRYWSSGEVDGNLAWYLYFYDSDVRVYNYNRSWGFSVRAVRDTPLVTGPTVKVDSVETGDPWSKITVNYTLGGTDAKTDYKVAFDVTAGGVTKGVTNAAAKVENGATNAVIDTAALFGAATPDTKAKVKVSLIALKSIDYSKPIQLWEGGPLFAQCNVGATTPEGFGILTNFNGAAQAVTAAMGTEWRVPSDGELKMLAGKNDGDKVCSNVWTTCNNVAGRRFFGMTSGYEDKSIFLPAAGYDRGGGREDAGVGGNYWSSTVKNADFAWHLPFDGDYAGVYSRVRGYGLSVRAVQDPSAKPEPVETAEAEFWLGPTEIKVSLTTGTGYGYAVSNLTLMAEIAPSSAGGTTYLLPIGAKVGIYCVAEADYDVVGTNPYVIDEVKFDTTIDAGELPTAEVRPGTEANPWMVGDGVTAYVKGATLIINGTGAVASTPWTDRADSVVELVKTKGVTGLEGIVATLPALTAVNGLTLAELNGLAAGAVKASGFNAIAIDPATQKATLTVVVKTAASVDAKEEDWTEAATKDVEVEATSPTGFFIVAPPK